MRRLSQFGRFWYDFVVGDDWTIAVAVVVIVTITDIAAHAGAGAWPILPIGVAAALCVSIRRAAGARGRALPETPSAATNNPIEQDP